MKIEEKIATSNAELLFEVCKIRVRSYAELPFDVLRNHCSKSRGITVRGGAEYAQREERNVKTPCSICNRDLYTMRMEGCENSKCGLEKPEDCEQAMQERDALLNDLENMQRELNSDVV